MAGRAAAVFGVHPSTFCLNRMLTCRSRSARVLGRPRAAPEGSPGAGSLGQALGDEAPQLAGAASAVSSASEASEAVLDNFTHFNIPGGRARQERLTGLSSTRKVLC